METNNDTTFSIIPPTTTDTDPTALSSSHDVSAAIPQISIVAETSATTTTTTTPSTVNMTRLFVAGVPDVTEDELRAVFNTYPGMISLIQSEKGFGFIGYDNETSAVQAIKDLNEYTIRGRTLHVALAKERTYGGRGEDRGEGRGEGRSGRLSEGERNESAKKCYHCFQTGHFAKECPKVSDSERERCFNCQGYGHRAKECSEKKMSFQQARERNRSYRSNRSYRDERENTRYDDQYYDRRHPTRSPSPRAYHREYSYYRRSRSRSPPRSRYEEYQDRRYDDDRGSQYHPRATSSYQPYEPPPPTSAYERSYHPTTYPSSASQQSDQRYASQSYDQRASAAYYERVNYPSSSYQHSPSTSIYSSTPSSTLPPNAAAALAVLAQHAIPSSYPPPTPTTTSSVPTSTHHTYAHTSMYPTSVTQAQSSALPPGFSAANDPYAYTRKY